MFELRGLLKALFLPPGLFLLALAFALPFGRRRAKPRLAWCALCVLAATSTPLVSNWTVRSLENLHPTPTISALMEAPAASRVQAIVVLGGGIRLGALEDPDQSALNRHSLERVNYAARLHRETGLPLLVSGGTIAPASVSEAHVMQRVFKDHYGIDVRWAERNSINTRENAQFSAVKLKRDGITRVLLVTTAMHMPRSVMEFEREGMTVVPAASGFYASGPVTWRALLPGLGGAQGLAYAAHEWVGLLWYKVSAMWNPVARKVPNV